MSDLQGKIAVVTGASRGVGQGIAIVLGKAGATVYVTGRSVRGEPTTSGNPEDTIEETAEMVTDGGGEGIPVQCDHTDDEQVAALFDRIQKEQGHLDILVNNVWGGYENMDQYDVPFWEQPVWRWEAMIDRGAYAHFITSRYAAPLMLPQRKGLIVTTTYRDLKGNDPDHMVMFAKYTTHGLIRMMACHLKAHNIASIGLGLSRWVWSRHDMTAIYASIEKHGSLDLFLEEEPKFKEGESPEYPGRAVKALALDPDVMAKTGMVIAEDDLASEFEYSDIGGWAPAYIPGMKQ